MAKKESQFTPAEALDLEHEANQKRLLLIKRKCIFAIRDYLFHDPDPKGSKLFKRIEEIFEEE